MNILLSSVVILFSNLKCLLLYGFMVGMMVGLEELVGSVVFYCLCEGYFVYGLVFFWVLVMFLFFVGILVDRDLWKFVIICNRCWMKYLIFCYFKVLFFILYVFIRVCIVLVVWLVLLFLW